MLWIGRMNIVKMAILPKPIYRFNVAPMRQPITLFTELEQVILKFRLNQRKSRIAKAIEREQNKTGCTTLPDFRQCCKATIITVVWYWHKYIHMEQNRQPNNRSKHPQSILDKKGKEIQSIKNCLFSQQCWENWTASNACKLMKLQNTLISYLKYTPYTKINSN